MWSRFIACTLFCVGLTAITLVYASCGDDASGTMDGGARVDGGPPDAPGVVCMTTHDEDGDGINDCDDNCPTIANSDEADRMDGMGMGDGVGDVCDPRPTEDGDSFFFIGFGSADDLEEYFIEATGFFDAMFGIPYQAGNGRVENDQLRVEQTPRSPSVYYLALDRLMPPLSLSGIPIVIDTTVHINGSSADIAADGLPADNDLTPRPNAGVVTAFKNSSADMSDSDSGHPCVLEKRSAASTRLKLATINGAAPVESLDTFGLSESNTYRFSQYLYLDQSQGTTYHICQATLRDDGQDTMALNEQMTVQNGLSEGSVGIMMTRAGGAFDYLIIYMLGGPLENCSEGAEPCF